MPDAVVLDASVAVELVVPGDYGQQAAALMAVWRGQNVALVAPTLWLYEVTSALRKHLCAGKISAAQTDRGLARLLDLGVELVPPIPELQRRALWWAAQTNQRAAYDAAYLAVAESVGGQFWTLDRRIFDAAQAVGAYWVHHAGAIE